MTMQNPFFYGKPVSGSDFCPRPELESKIEQIVQSSGRVYLTGKHKVGKTSLIKHLSEKLEKTHLLIHVDFRLVEDHAGVERKIIQALLDAEARVRDFREILQHYAKYAPSMKLDPVSNSVAFSLPFRTQIGISEVAQALDCIRKNSNLIPIVFFDNLQELNKIGDKEIMQTLLAKCHEQKEHVFVFSESEDLFKEKLVLDSLFQGIIEQVQIPEIKEENYLFFAQQKMAQRAIVLPDNAGKELLKISGSLTGDRQMLFYSLWEVSKDKEIIDSIKVAQAVNNIFEKYQELYLSLFDDLTSLQKRVMKLLASDEDSKIYSKGFADKVGQTASNTVVKIMQALTNRRLIYKQGSHYKFFNPFFREWIKKNFPV